MTVKELVYTEGHVVVLSKIDNGDAVYYLMAPPGELLMTFRVPKEDLLGAVFNLTDTPKVFMRWIRKELERQKQEAEMIERAKKDWAEGKQS